MQCIFWDDKLWILPADGQYLLQCSKDFRQLNKIEYDEFIPMEDKDKTFLFYRMVLQKENLWLIPRNVPYFIKIEKNGKPTRIDIDHIEVIEYLRQHEQPFSEAVAVEDKIYFPPFMLADFYVLDTKDNSLKKNVFRRSIRKNWCLKFWNVKEKKNIFTVLHCLDFLILQIW